VPGGVTLNPDEVDITFSMGDRFTLPLPFWGSAMDGVVDVDFAIAMGKLGGVAVLNLDGVHTRYEDSAPVIKKIADADKATLNAVLKEAYREPVKPGLISERIKAIKAAGVPCAVSTVPARAEERAEIVQKAGADIFVGMNPIKDGAYSRTKQSLKEIRHVYLDIDRDGDQAIEIIRTSLDVPMPNFVLNTSPQKYQVVWRIEGVNQQQAETLLHSMANHFAADLAATDATRALRLPGAADDGDFVPCPRGDDFAA